MLDGDKPTSGLVHRYGFSIAEIEPKLQHPSNEAGHCHQCCEDPAFAFLAIFCGDSSWSAAKLIDIKVPRRLRIRYWQLRPSRVAGQPAQCRTTKGRRFVCR